jgi:hypothetical protein
MPTLHFSHFRTTDIHHHEQNNMRVFVRVGSKTIALEVESCDTIDAVMMLN